MECRDHGAGTEVPPSWVGAGKAQGLWPRSNVHSEDMTGELGGTWRVAQGCSAMFCLLGYALHCCYCCMHVIAVMHCTVNTVAYMYRV